MQIYPIPNQHKCCVLEEKIYENKQTNNNNKTHKQIQRKFRSMFLFDSEAMDVTMHEKHNHRSTKLNLFGKWEYWDMKERAI